MALDPETFDLLKSTLQRFVREKLVPREDEVAETNGIPADIRAEMQELGLFGLSIPEAFGGLGLGMEEEVNLAFELGKTSPAFRSLLGTNNGIGSQGLIMDGTDAQKQNYLPKLASGEMIASFALTEAEAGSDARSLRTSARRDGNDFILNGTKRYITNAPHAGLFTVFARTEDPDNPVGSITAFLVEAGTPGLSIGPVDKKMGQQGSLTSDVIFENCRVPASAVLGEKTGQGFRTAMKVLDRGRLHISAVCVGAAERLIADSLDYAMERKQFGQPIAEFQLVQAMLADSRAEAFAARCMVLETARAKDRAEVVTTDAACCKMYASEMVGRVADRAVQIHGGAGYMSEYAIERFYRDVRLFRIYEGTTQIQQLVIARNMIKQRKSEL
ncbi:acyl-CoA dehydrogenase family protein [Neptunicoccus sediminis]|uniref:acyl-CoA dehydrogenase family protein n=1 Tax=Neptunicoccus sediminis TaxID=1892596 RepID=UPI00084602FA|nr:acyl-CoA dehydrogenase family protein [Neptunicoccus sediminis]